MIQRFKNSMIQKFNDSMIKAESLGSAKSPDFVVLKARLLPCHAGRRPTFSFDAARRYAEPGIATPVVEALLR
jgi:hypothetical protein